MPKCWLCKDTGIRSVTKTVVCTHSSGIGFVWTPQNGGAVVGSCGRCHDSGSYQETQNEKCQH